MKKKRANPYCHVLSVLTQPADVKRFHRDSSLHGKSESSNGGWLFHQQLGDCMGLINGQPWKKLRAVFYPYLTYRSVARAYPQLVSSATTHLRRLTASSQDNSKTVYIDANNLAPFPFFATAEFIYGPLTSKEREQLWALGERSLQLMGTVLSGGVYRFKIYEWLRPSTRQLVEDFERDWTAFNESLYSSRKSVADHAAELDRPPFISIWESFNDSGLPQRMVSQLALQLISLFFPTYFTTVLLLRRG